MTVLSYKANLVIAIAEDCFIALFISYIVIFCRFYRVQRMNFYTKTSLILLTFGIFGKIIAMAIDSVFRYQN